MHGGGVVDLDHSHSSQPNFYPGPCFEAIVSPGHQSPVTSHQGRLWPVSFHEMVHRDHHDISQTLVGCLVVEGQW